METKKCLFCGKEFENNKANTKKYCSGTCARADYHKKNHVYAATGKKIIQCAECGKDVEVNASGRVTKYCSNSCKTKHNYFKKHPTGTGNCLHCGKEIILHYSKDGKTKNKFCCQLCGDKYRDKLNPQRVKDEINKPHRRFNIVEHGAKNRGYSFNLSLEQFITFWNKPCHYCGSEINGVGIDRVDNNIGYELDNCVPCCSKCNKMKLNLSLSDFFSHIKQIYEHLDLNKLT